jgi:ribosomal protein S18 acetylase RimI-like enzyme
MGFEALFRRFEILAMPELAIAEDHHFAAFPREVRMPENEFAVAAVSDASFREGVTKLHLDSRILSADSAHRVMDRFLAARFHDTIIISKKKKVYIKAMLKLLPGKEKDLPAVLKLFRRVNASLLEEGNDMWSHGYPSEEDFRADLGAGLLYLAKDGGRLVGGVSVSFDPLETFFPESKDHRKRDRLLDKCSALPDDNLLIVHRLMVDPMDRRKGVASSLIDYLKSLYPRRLWIFSVYPTNAKAISFYDKKGFLDMGPYEFEYGDASKQILFCSRHSRD